MSEKEARVFSLRYFIFKTFKIRSSNFILPYSNLSNKKKISHTDCSHFLVSARTHSISRYIHIQAYAKGGPQHLFLEKSTKISQPSPAKKKRTSPYRVKLDGTEHLNATCIVFRYSYVLWPRLICYSFFI